MLRRLHQCGLHHGVSEVVVAVVSKGADVLSDHVLFGGVDPRLSYGLGAEVLAGEFAEGAVSSRHYDRFRAVVGDELVGGVQGD